MPVTENPSPVSDKTGTGAAAVARAAEADVDDLRNDGETRSEATDWFLSDEAEEAASAKLPINIAPAGQKERVIDFGIQVLARERIKELRENATVTKSDGTQQIDEMEANLRIASEALIDPDLTKPENRRVRGQQYLDPGDALSARFAYKPGIIDQIAAKVAQISGYNDADVKEVKAAGN